MPNYEGIITNFAVGDSIDIVRTITNVPSGQLIQSALFTVKALEGLTDSLLCVSGSINANTVTFALQGADTTQLYPVYPLPYWIEITTTANRTYTPEKGRIIAAFGADC